MCKIKFNWLILKYSIFTLIDLVLSISGLLSVLSVYAIKVLVDLEQKTMEKIDEYEGYYYRNLGDTENTGATNVNGLYDDVIERMVL